MKPWEKDPKFFQWYPHYQHYRPSKQYWRRYRRRHWLNKYLAAQGCCKCGYNENPSALQFDHIDPATKLGNIKSSDILLSKLQKVIAEVRKCRILCANCHVISTTENKQRHHTFDNTRRLKDFELYRKD